MMMQSSFYSILDVKVEVSFWKQLVFHENEACLYLSLAVKDLTAFTDHQKCQAVQKPNLREFSVQIWLDILQNIMDFFSLMEDPLYYFSSQMLTHQAWFSFMFVNKLCNMYQ